MNANYVPFLKFKGNEVAALKALDKELKVGLTPFFDIPKRDEMTEDDFASMVTKAAKSAAANLENIEAFFLDNFDIADELLIDGNDNYAFILEAFKDLPFIPVIGLDRTAHRNQLVFGGRAAGIIKMDTIGIRLHGDDFLNFELVRDELDDLIAPNKKLFNNWVLILDNRFCLYSDVKKRSADLTNFIIAISRVYSFERVILTGSSVPASISEILAVGADLNHHRVELDIYRSVRNGTKEFDINLGDYTVVSPLYSDANIPKEAMQNVITAKITYSYKDVHYFARGASIKTHPRGPLQYNDIAKHIISKAFYRGAPYSFGDQFLDEKANFIGNNVTANSILKPTINLHMAFMIKDFVH
jgi:hypothetical protein